MKVFIVWFYSWFDKWHESNHTEIERVFDSREKAERYIEKQEAKSKRKRKDKGTDWHIEEKDLD